MLQSVRQFVRQSYKLINPSNPTQPLVHDDLQDGIFILNDLLNSYASSGLMLTIAQEVNIPIFNGKAFVTVGPPPVPPALPLYDINIGRMANLESAWLLLDGVTYPLIDKSRDEFHASFKYDPLKGLPRLILQYYETGFVNLRLYPAPDQFYQFFLRAKFQLSNLTSADNMSILPDYYSRFLKFALARDLALYDGRTEAWTEKLENTYKEAYDLMVGSSEVNLSITGDRASLLNGAYRVRAGI